MNNSTKLLALCAAAMAAIGNPELQPSTLQGRTYGAVPNPDTRQLREFSVKGKKVMAYSRKDAIKRIKHQKQ